MAILHRTHTLSALMPRYVERFRCIGPSCEDTCCFGWPVHIDKKTYKAYRKESTPELKRLGEYVKRLPGANSDKMYGVIVPVGEAQQCAAFQGGMCSIHASVGESYLSNVCHSYPRINRKVNGQYEQGISLSCPEAARLALLAEDAFDFVEVPIQLRDATVMEINGRYGLPPTMVVDIRIFCIGVMRTRELALWQRLALLGTFCDALTRLCSAGEQSGAQALIDNFTHWLETGELVSVLDQIQPNKEAQAMVFATLWAAKGFDTPSPFLKKVMAQISLRFGADEHGQVSADALVQAYVYGMSRLDEALAPAPWLIENYLLNEMFSQLFPFNGADPYDSYLQLVARFGLLRLLLAVQCNMKDGIPDMASIISTVHLQCRRFQHDNNYTKLVNRSLQESGWADLDKLYRLIKI